jgi:hypothetical protein
LANLSSSCFPPKYLMTTFASDESSQFSPEAKLSGNIRSTVFTGIEGLIGMGLPSLIFSGSLK